MDLQDAMTRAAHTANLCLYMWTARRRVNGDTVGAPTSVMFGYVGLKYHPGCFGIAANAMQQTSDLSINPADQF